MPVYLQSTQQAAESQPTTTLVLTLAPTPDFAIAASLPSVVPADGTAVATSTIIVNPVGDFTRNVTLSDLPVPEDLKCTPIDPATISNSSGKATLSCSSIAARSYPVTIIGTSSWIRHNATTTFTFATFASPDFTITAISPVSFTSGSATTSDVTIKPENGFHSEVVLAGTVSPGTGLSASLSPSSLLYGSGTSTATFSSFTPGDYTVTITATGGASRHAATVNVHVAAVAPAAPAPPTTTGLVPAVFYAIAGAIIVVAVVGTFLLLRRARSSGS